MAEVCTHLDQIRPVKPKTKGCEECLKMGDSWVHLRLCLSCGHVGCCDSSKNKHATKHFHAVKHPIVRSIEPGEHWMWCYIDEVMFEDDQTALFDAFGNSKEAAMASIRIPPTTSREICGAMCSQGSTIIFPPIKDNTKASPTVKYRKRFKNPANKK